MQLNKDIASLIYSFNSKLRFWRILAALLVIVAVGAIASSNSIGGFGSDHIARFDVTGKIADTRVAQERLQAIADSTTARALIVYIESSGGGVAASEELYERIKAISQRIPVVTVMGSVGASGGYIVALAGERIFARETTLTGSIGVLIQWPELRGFLDKIGINRGAITSAPAKGGPDLVDAPNSAIEENLIEVVESSNSWFRNLVKSERNLDNNELSRVADGRIFLGSEALAYKLIDEIGGLNEAKNWLLEEKELSDQLPTISYNQEEPLGFLSQFLGSAVSRLVSVPFDGTVNYLERGQGLQAVWSPNQQN